MFYFFKYREGRAKWSEPTIQITGGVCPTSDVELSSSPPINYSETKKLAVVNQGGLWSLLIKGEHGVGKLLMSYSKPYAGQSIVVLINSLSMPCSPVTRAAFINKSTGLNG